MRGSLLSPHRGGSRQLRRRGRALGWLALGVLVTAIVGGAVYSIDSLLRRHVSRVPPVLRPDEPREVPDFALIDQDGRAFGRRDLLGRVWVADFIFTHCGAACPMMTSRMKELQDEIARSPGNLTDRVRLVSFSVDWRRDSPERLKDFAERYGADPASWRFLSGEKDQVVDLSVKGFHLSAVASAPVANGVPTVDHSNRFVLVDHRGRIRGYYNPQEYESHLEELLRDVRTLVREMESAGA